MKKLLIIFLFLPYLGTCQKDTSYWMCRDMDWGISEEELTIVVNDSLALEMGEVVSTTYFRRAIRYDFTGDFYIRLEAFFRRFKYRKLEFVIIETIDSVNFYEVQK